MNQPSTLIALLSPDERKNILAALRTGKTDKLKPFEAKFLTGAVMTMAHVQEEGGREMPFAERLTTEKVANILGVDEEGAKEAYNGIRNQEVANRLTATMGDDSQLPAEDPTTISAILDAVVPEQEK